MGLTPLLIAFSGLPGTGKSSIARQLAARIGAVYLRVDTVEQALLRSGEMRELGGAGYEVLYALGADNLKLGRTIIADSVNPFGWTRTRWREIGTGSGAGFLGVEVVCSDRIEHRRRVETRAADIAGHALPDWQAVVDRDYEDWIEADIRIDTATTSAEAAVAAIMAGLPISP